jgi:hypothetical protein
LLFAMNVAADADRSKLTPGDYKIVTDEQGGGWRGRVVRVRSNGAADARPVLSIRTWLPT